jgi:hypothetical protein
MKHLFLILMLAFTWSAVSAQRVKFKFPIDYLRQEPSHTLTIPRSTEPQLKFYNNNLYTYNTTELVYQKFAKRPAYAEMSISNDTSTVTFAGTTATVLQDLTVGPKSAEFTMISDSVLQFTGNATGVFRISYSLSMSFTEAANIINGFIQVNGTEAPRSKFRQTITTANTERVNVAVSFIVSLPADALVRLMLQPSTHTSSDDILVYQANINIVQLE